jgi:hypothetical protein
MTKPKASAPTPAPVVIEIMLPPQPWITRVPTTAGGIERIEITANGLAAVREIASDGGSQRKVASDLGISNTAFKALMARDERVRLQYEAGLADEEAILIRGLKLAAANGQFVPAMFLLKSRHGYVEGAPTQTQVGIQIVVPDSLDRAAFEERMQVKVLTDQSGGTQ